MLCRAAFCLRTCQQSTLHHVKRNLGVTSICQQKAQALEPIQQLFLDKLRDYTKKATGGKLVDASPETTKSLQDELQKIDKMYGADKEDLTKFPVFNFTDPVLERVGVDAEVRSVAEESAAVEEAVEEDKPYWEV